MRGFLIFIFLISFSNTVRAQVFDSYDFGFALNSTDLLVDMDPLNDAMKSGLGVGLGFHVFKTLSPNMSLQSGLELNIRNIYLDLPDQPITNDQNEVIGTIEYTRARSAIYLLSVPFELQANMGGYFDLAAGPRLDLKLGNHNGSYSYEYQDQTIEREHPIFDNAETLTVGYSLGIGKKVYFANTNFSVVLRYNGDFSRMVRKPDFVDMRKSAFDFWIQIPLFK